jgi:hypothetical protein
MHLHLPDGIRAKLERCSKGKCTQEFLAWWNTAGEEIHAYDRDQDLLIEVGQSTTTGKWHARITTQQGVRFYSPPCDTESEAMECKECALEIIRRDMLKRIEMPFRVI